MLKKTIFFGLLILLVIPTVIKSDDDDKYDPKDLTDYFGTNSTCTYDRSENDCRNGNEYKFYLKMYDIKALYKRKYNVELDTSLIMSALFYNHEEPPTVFERNLNDYNRSAVKNGDSITNLDWEYDFKNDPCYTYLNANDFSYDMQILAKNMVRKTIKYKCIGDNDEESSEEEVEDIEDSNYSTDTLVCENGSYDSDSVSSSYKLDLDKYDDFLLEYTKLKYHTPGTEIKSCPVEDNTNYSYNYDSSSYYAPRPLSPTGQATIDKLNKIAYDAAANSLSRYVVTGWYGSDDEWCAMFISWLFNQIGGLEKYYHKDAGSGSGARPMVQAGKGTWVEDDCTDPTIGPRAGDVVHCYEVLPGNPYRVDRMSSGHVAYVYDVDDTYIYTVEGNNRDKYHVVFNKRERRVCGAYGINGYYRPYY